MPESCNDALVDALLPDARWVLALAKRLARDQATAEDIAQSTIALALEQRPAVDGGLRPWLARVVSRLSVHAVRSDARRKAREALASSVRDSTPVGEDEVLERFELQQELAKRVGALPDPYRSVLIRRYYEGLSVNEIALVTGASAGTVRSQLSRGLERLRVQYEDESSGRSALGAFLLAAGFRSDSIALPNAELLVMQTSTKIFGAAALVLAVSAIYFGLELGSRESRDLAAAEAPEFRGELSPAESAMASIADEAGEGLVRMAVAPGTENTPSKFMIPGEEAKPTVTTVRARVLDVDLNPIVGATISSILPDGRQRGTSGQAHSGAGGHVVLELNDGSVRKSRSEVYDMIFAVSGPNRATTFVIDRPKLHGATDLGDILLEPGAMLFGTCVDAKGRPLAGVVLYAGVGVVTGSLDALRISGPNPDVARPHAVSAADGSFELRGLQSVRENGLSKRARLWAHVPGHYWTITEPIRITPSARVDMGQVMLEAVPSELRIEGLVVRPDGSPAAGAHIDYAATDSPQHGRVEADEEGRFVVIAKSDAPLEFIAHDGTEEFGMSRTRLAERGEQFELGLRYRRVLSVTVVDTDGVPQQDAHIMATLADGTEFFEGGGRLIPGENWAHTDENGRRDIEVPGQSFRVEVRSPGSGSKSLGPFDVDSAPRTLTVTLPLRSEATGRVLSYGVPVAGATVYAMRLCEGFAAMTGGFPNRYASGTSSVTTDAEGRFVAPLWLKWPKIGVVARAEGLASGEVVLGARTGENTRGIEIHLTEGGRIEGAVTPPPGMKAAGLYVAASRGDGLPLSTIVDSKGRYRFEGLTPGNWRVEGRVREVRTELLSTSRDPEDLRERWNAHVVDRETLELDVDMRHLGGVLILGRLSIDGSAPPAGWKVEAIAPTHSRGPGAAPRAELESDGSFEFSGSPGRVELRFVGPLAGGATVEMLREVQLAGPRFEWEGALFTAPIDEPLGGSFEWARVVRGDPFEGDREITTVSVDEDGVLRARVPVGDSRLEVPSEDALFETAWKTIRAFEVR